MLKVPGCLETCEKQSSWRGWPLVLGKGCTKFEATTMEVPLCYQPESLVYLFSKLQQYLPFTRWHLLSFPGFGDFCLPYSYHHQETSLTVATQSLCRGRARVLGTVTYWEKHKVKNHTWGEGIIALLIPPKHFYKEKVKGRLRLRLSNGYY